VSFLYPYFLWTLAFLAIPLIIHLFRFRRFRKLIFSDISFLKAALTESNRRRRLRHLLLLALRIIAIAFLVVTFAFPVTRNTLAPGGTAYVSVFIDNSLSMDLPANGGTLLDEARRRAEALMKAYGEDARFQVLAASPLPGGGRFTTLQDALNQMAALKPEPALRPISSVMRRIAADLQASGGDEQRHNIIVISDFQKTFGDFENIDNDTPLPPRWYWVPVTPSRALNVAVDSAWVAGGYPTPGQNETITFRLRNLGNEDARDIPVEFLLEGVKKSATTVSLPAEAVQEVSFPLAVPEGGVAAELKVEDGGASFDNTFYVLLNASLKRRVVVWWESPASPLLKALATESQFEVSAAPLGQAVYQALEGADVLFMVGIISWTSGLASVVKDFVQQGGTLVLFPPGEGTVENAQFLSREFQLPWPGILQKNTLQVAPFQPNQPFFSGVVKAEALRVKMPEARLWYLTDWPGAEKILAFPDGSAFWQRIKRGQGWVVACAVPLDMAHSDLPTHGLFVPLVLRTVIESRPTLPLYYEVSRPGSSLLMEIPRFANNARPSEAPFRWRSDQDERLEFVPEQNILNDRVVFRFTQAQPFPGMYSVVRDDSVWARVAINAIGPESLPSYLTPQELREIAAQKGWSNVEVLDKESATKATLPSLAGTLGDNYWRWVLACALAALVLESFLSRTWRKRVADNMRSL
jgi:hypothetical protein